ncbi:chemotaxis protein CheW [Rhodobacter capsulatus]|uniref:chemotaxis protein CheW n=1 Tax=Rhodobacter capsulatus TaxID=1061 RepID=UPI0040278453
MTQMPNASAFAEDEANSIALIIRVCGEALAIPVSHVHEVIDPIPRTRVPRASAFAPWLINVRGAVVPLVDVRQRLRMPVSHVNQGRIVVLDIALGVEAFRLAMLADEVQEVVDIDPAAIESLPENGSPWPSNYVTGALRRGDDLILLLDPENLFRPEQAA